jgi:Bor protein
MNFMKKFLSICLIAISFSLLMSSCFAHKFAIGDGAQTGVQVTEKNNYFLFGLIPGKTSDPQKMAGGANDFEVTEVQTFLDGLIGVLTFGIYTPSTTTVQK